jgi:DNA invertase Pin-like site-specific DNA recombinase
LLDAQRAAKADCRKEAIMKKQPVTILYARFSVNDEKDKESNSIGSQRILLEDYAKKNGLLPTTFIADDGFSGTIWNRPGWQEVVAKINSGEALALVVKDSTRIGRDHLRVGLYRELFAEKGVRLICINDGYDSDKGEDDFTPFRDILSEWYARDTSRKIRSAFEARTSEGKHVTGVIPYGYLHDPANRQNWILDETAAEVVRRIFQLVIEGNGVYQIANILEQEKTLIPTAHWESIGESGNVRHHSYKNQYMWRGGVISNIIEREEYMGNLILRKTQSDSYKRKKRKETPKDERLVFEGAIPQIIDEETWHNAQRLRRTVRRPAKNGDPPYRLTGLLYCADCGAKMTHDRSADFREGRKAKNEYVCSNYRQRTRECSIHFIRVPIVEKLILDAIRSVSGYVRDCEGEFVERVRETTNLRHEESVMENKKTLNKSLRRLDELGILIKKLYESFALGKIPEKHFDTLLADYDTEQTALEAETARLQSEIDVFDIDSTKVDKFINLVRRYTDFSELTTPMLNEFVEKVIVHEADKTSGKRVQKVDIYLNFIGKFDAPHIEAPPTAEEIEAERQKQEKRRAQQRERNRKFRERKKHAA